jgi:choline monooxygenase
MFVHKHHLEYLLESADYTSERRRQAEVEHLFLPAWHLAGTKSELRRDGDFLTFELFGYPVQLRRAEGKYYAVENTCAHRHCLLTSQERGHSPTIRCQYHGWEFQPDGRTGRIPDAGCFRPWDRENARLASYRVETCGDLIFVALSDEAPPLREFLSPYAETVEEYFSTPIWQLKDIWEYECPANWKVPAENTLETYHIPCVHPTSFNGIYPSEQNVEHLLHHRYTAIEYDTSEDAQLAVWQRRLARWLGTEPSDIHVHRHIHPHTIVVTSALFSYIVNYLPIAPDRTRVRLRMYSYRGTKTSPWAACLAGTLAIFSRRTMRKIMLEDLGIFAAQQRGLSLSRHKGVIGTREERIYAFQQYILTELGRWPE